MKIENKNLAFFRQSGWMMIASTVMGIFMFAVHKFSKYMPAAEYSVLVTLLQVVNLLGIPAVGLQTVFAQQAAAAIDDSQRRQLTATVRAVLLWTFLIWLVMGTGVVVFRHAILLTLKIANPAALWLTVAVGLAQLWLPIVLGLLQGQQNFLWLGTATILNGVGRFVAVAVLVAGMGYYAAGATMGILLGLLATLALALWHSRATILAPTERFNWQPWLTRVAPLTLGLGATIFMLSADMIVVQSYFDKETTGLYAAAGMIGRGLVFFTIPLTAVMFPKIVQSAARAEKSNVLALALGATALLGAGAAVFCTLFPKLPLMLVYPKEFLEIAPLVPWFAWCMLPLTLSNVLVNNLLARQRFEAVPWLAIVAAGYGTALVFTAKSFLAVVQTIGLSSLVLLAVAAWFTWGKPAKS